MSSNQRLIVIVGLVVVCALGFVVLKATDESSTGDLPPEPTVAATTPAPDAGVDSGPASGSNDGTDPTATTGAERSAERPATPAVAQIVVRGLEPVGGVKKLVFRKGDTIRFTVVSDEPEEVHFHGYDVARDVAPGRPAAFAVPANIEGIFEAELEHSGTQIASITVEP
ncbi:hypothetical protein [Conexibacter sp. CPCC 206217]|uniref:hypothetical protein n=1 Tax=Conexibacter sp. CPCC 206217 TaxID=3064574 RepID=UPI002725F04E|nr:hypothetical protein [Conexibacter sp. CPCC 206217]MDO8211785.1 hypothetical protein [Conexibacter sp. CPCC 206217]